MMQLNRILIVLLICCSAGMALAGRVDKGYKALYIFDYFSAKKHFTKALKYNESPGAQGLAIIYYRDDNPFHSYDSALVYIERSIATFDMVKDRKKEKYAAYGFTKDSLYALRQKVSSQFFARASDTFTVASFTYFMDRHPWATEVSRARELRDSLAFFQVVRTNTSTAFKSYMDTYPESAYFELAEENFYDAQFAESTGDGTLDSYSTFIRNNPNSPLRSEAERKEFELATRENSPKVYEEFITNYPKSPYVDTAWWRWYQLELSDYHPKVISFFLDSTAIPFQDELLEERAMMDVTYLPFRTGTLFGYMDSTGITRIDATFEYASAFQEGLAIVAKDGRYGFVNKLGEIQVSTRFDAVSDFQSGLAIVEKEGKFGMIDRNGYYVFEPIYDDLGPFSEGFSYAAISDRYGYYNRRGEMVIPHVYDDAYDFTNAMAKVEVDGMIGFIDTTGDFQIPARYESLQWYNDSILVYRDSSRYGLMHVSDSLVVPARFAWVNPMKEGFSVAELDERLVYLDSSGVIVIDNGFSIYPNYQLKGEFNVGVAIVVKKEYYGRIDTSGKLVTSCKFDNIGLGSDVFPASEDGLWGLFDGQGKPIVKPQFDGVFRAANGSFIVNQSDSLGVFDSSGSLLLPPTFDGLEVLKDDFYLVRSGSAFGVYQGQELVVPVRYDSITLFDNHYLVLNKDEYLSYFDMNSNRIIERKE